MIIIGIDPGTRITGYGIIIVQGSSYQALDYGCIRPPADAKLSDRYLAIFDGIDALLERYSPQALVVESQFGGKNIQSVLKLGMAKGTALIPAKKRGIPVFEYAPKKAKCAVVGNGSASKQQVQGMIQLLLKLSKPPTPEDASDALALAICHAQAIPFLHLTSAEI